MNDTQSVADDKRIVLSMGQAAALCGHNTTARMIRRRIDSGYLKGFVIPGSKHRRVFMDSLEVMFESVGLVAPEFINLRRDDYVDVNSPERGYNDATGQLIGTVQGKPQVRFGPNETDKTDIFEWEELTKWQG